MQLRSLDISQARNQSQSACCPTAACRHGTGSAWGQGHPQLSGSSDSCGGKESHSPGSGSPHWYLLGPRGWGDWVERIGQGGEDSIPHPMLFHHTPKECTLHLGLFSGKSSCFSAGPLSLSYLMRAIMKAGLGSHNTLISWPHSVCPPPDAQ